MVNPALRMSSGNALTGFPFYCLQHFRATANACGRAALYAYYHTWIATHLRLPLDDDVARRAASLRSSACYTPLHHPCWACFLCN